MALDLSCVGKRSAPSRFEYGPDRVILYALGVGAGVADLKFAYEGAAGFAALPTFAVVPATGLLFEAVAALKADLTRLLHGEQAVRWHAPVPAEGVIVSTWEITHVFDKGKGALAVLEVRSVDGAGRPLFDNTISLYIRGEGGFGGERGQDRPRADPPARDPDFAIEQPTSPAQALLYRLSGDKNRLHAEPAFAAAAGFERPILHGLCTFGFAGRALLDGALGGDPSRLKALSARFSGVVYPGDTLRTEGWDLGGGRWALRTSTSRGVVALSGFEAETA